jgi:hypothetical protein
MHSLRLPVAYSQYRQPWMRMTPKGRDTAHRLAAVVVTLALVVAVIGLAAAAAVNAGDAGTFQQGAGVARNLPLGVFAAIMAISWMPMFMPMLVPLVAVFFTLVLALYLPARWAWRHSDNAATHSRAHWRQATGDAGF